ncbi:hypothetical protein C8J57DRAFT_1258490 [Mycena rebaudengoi]|nr:hypothetical protein C8J57DRAFT_1258490 [Mycena rebaudengoi]
MAAFPYPPQQLFRSPMSVDNATSVVRRPDGTPFESNSVSQEDQSSIRHSLRRLIDLLVSFSVVASHFMRHILATASSQLYWGIMEPRIRAGSQLSSPAQSSGPPQHHVTAALGTLPTDYEEYDENGRLATGVDYVILGWVPTVPSDSWVALEKFARSPEFH